MLRCHRALLRAALVLVVATSLAACGDEATSTFDDSVVVSDQIADPTDRVVIDSVTADADGWIVVYADAGGSFGAQLGHTAIARGENANVAVDLARIAVDQETLHAMLHVDEGETELFEFPGSDEPVTDAADDLIFASFTVEVPGQVIPSLTVADQKADPRNEVVVAALVSVGAGFVAIHDDADGAPGAQLGVTPVTAGASADVVVTLSRDAIDGERLWAQLHIDAAGDASFDASEDAAVISPLDGEVIAHGFQVSVDPLPEVTPAIEAVDQTADPANTVVVASADSNGPGFVVVRADDAGSAGTVLGFAAVAYGSTSNISVTLDRDAVNGETLHAELRADAGQIGVWEEGADPVAAATSFVVSAPVDAAITVADQTADPANQVAIASVLTPAAAFVVVHEDDGAGGFAGVIGNAAVAAGTTADVVITLDRDAVDGETLHAMLHTDSTDDGGAYDPATDGPYTDAGGNLVSPTFVVTVTAASAASVTVTDQIADPANKVVVASVVSDGAGFVAVHEDDGNGSFGAAIGVTAVAGGANADVVVELSREIVDGETLYAMLHIDATDDGEGYDPANDVPFVDGDGELVNVPFVVTAGPSVTAADQSADPANQVVVAEVVSTIGAGFIAIHEDDGNGSFGAAIGVAAVASGTNTDVVVTLARDAIDGETLYAMLHIDATDDGGDYDPANDAPYTDLDGALENVPFVVSVAAAVQASVTVADQIADPADKVFIANVVSDGAGFLAVHEDDGSGSFAAAIGVTAVADGDNGAVIVELSRDIVDGETLYAMLHIDATADGGEYDPANDTPYFDGAGALITPDFAVTAGPSVTVADQAADPADQVIIAEVVSTIGAGFLAVHEDDGSGGFAAAIGVAAVTAGTNTDVVVTLSRDAIDGETLHAMLHIDATDDGGDYDPANDAPYANLDGDLVSPTFVVSVAPPIEPEITVADQIADPADKVVIANVFAVGAGFVVIHEDSGGSPGDVIGNAPVVDGTNTDVVVELDRDIVDGETLYAMLHIDATDDGAYDPTNDTPYLTAGAELVNPEFDVTRPPTVTVTDQTADPANQIVIAEVDSSIGGGFIVIHEDTGDSFAAIIGSAAVAEGVNTNVTVTLDRDAVDGETLYAMLHIDANDDGGAYDPPNDTPHVNTDGELLTPTFIVTVLPVVEPTVTVVDQIADPADIVVIAEVSAVGPGFIVIHEDDDGSTGDAIGNAPVADGTHTDVVVELDRDIVDGETLYAMFHIDATDDAGIYDPASDTPYLTAGAELVNPEFDVTRPPTVTVADQVADPTDEVVIAEVDSSIGNAFIVIHEDDGGPAGVIGSVAVAGGVNTEVVVALDREVVAGETLYAMLHLDDTDDAGAYDPGNDMPYTNTNGDLLTPDFEVQSPGVTAGTLTLDDVSTLLTVPSATIAGAGFLVIHEDDGGPAGVIGNAALTDGVNTDIEIVLDRPAADGETLYAMLHIDAVDDGGYDPGNDLPYLVNDVTMVTPEIAAVVPAGTPAVRFTVSSSGSSGYKWDSAHPAAYADAFGGDSDAVDPELTLEFGWRYEIVNTVFGPHPFDFIEHGADPTSSAQDTVLLSQQTAGSLEADAEIDWVELTPGPTEDASFTVDEDFTAGVTGYRCAIHTSSMRGDVAIANAP